MKKSAFRLCRNLVHTAIAGLVLATLFALLDRFFWIFELFAHFTLQYLLVGIGLLLLAILVRSRRGALACLAIIAIHGAEIGWVATRYLHSGPTAAAIQNTVLLRVMQSNIYCHNNDKDNAIDQITQHSKDYDILVIHEYCYHWRQGLKERLKADFPYRYLDNNDYISYDTAIYSRTPLYSQEIRTGNYNYGYLRIYLPVYKTLLYTNHSTTPLEREPGKDRLAILYKIIREVAKEKRPAFVIGDFNHTPYASSFQRILDKTGLKLAHFPDGFYPTWPRFLPGPWLRIPIDHIVANEKITVLSRQPIEITGTDHMAMGNQLLLPAPKSKAVMKVKKAKKAKKAEPQAAPETAAKPKAAAKAPAKAAE